MSQGRAGGVPFQIHRCQAIRTFGIHFRILYRTSACHLLYSINAVGKPCLIRRAMFLEGHRGHALHHGASCCCVAATHGRQMLQHPRRFTGVAAGRLVRYLSPPTTRTLPR